MAHRLPEAFGFLALLVGGYALIRITLWYIFTRHLSKNRDERGDFE